MRKSSSIILALFFILVALPHGVQGKDSSSKKQQGKNEQSTMKTGAKVTMASGGVLAATSGIATTLGFTTSGIAAGSVAAATQATIANVATGSAFAITQSLGASGVFAAMGPIGLGALAVGGVAYYLLSE